MRQKFQEYLCLESKQEGDFGRWLDIKLGGARCGVGSMQPGKRAFATLIQTRLNTHRTVRTIITQLVLWENVLVRMHVNTTAFTQVIKPSASQLNRFYLHSTKCWLIFFLFVVTDSHWLEFEVSFHNFGLNLLEYYSC